MQSNDKSLIIYYLLIITERRKRKWIYEYFQTKQKRESERLKKERDSLLAKLNSIRGYKEDYENLITETKILRKRYQDLIAAVENVFEEYKARLEEL